MKRVIYILLIVLLLGVFLVAGLHVLEILMEYRAGEKTYQEMDQFISLPEPTQAKKQDTIMSDKENVQEAEPQEAEPQEDEEILWPIVDFDSLRQINGDVIGWIYIPDTNVNYPVVQGVNNDQYLYRLITGEYNSSGSIFLEAQIPADFSMQNNPIYGHNMKNGAMFAGITGYKSQDFYEEHPVAMLLTPDSNYLVHIFSGYVTDAWADAWELAFMQADFQRWLDDRVRKSYFVSETIPTTADRVLTFSTCSYETYEGRFVVHGVLEEIPKK